jgi:large subunit ribosomal protein L20
MARVKRGFKGRRAHKKWIKLAKGAHGRRKNVFKAALETAMRALEYAYRHRRTKKRDYRALWIQRINAAARLHGLSYSRLMNGLKLATIDIDRKMLADIAMHDEAAFGELANKAKAALGIA